jgi:acyl-coenzyme A synthetase/AMP-(fatty) acid ligase
MTAVTGNFVTTLVDLADQHGWWGNRAYSVRRAGDAFDSYTFGEVYTGVRATAAVFDGAGVRPGNRILIALPDGMDFVRAFLATLHVGGIAVPVNPMLPTRDFASLVERADPTVVVCGPALVAGAAGATVLGPGQLGDDPAGAPPVVPRAPADPAYALFTSGTTGAPKLCIHTHADPLVYDQAFGKPVLGLGPGVVTLSVSKCFFAYGLGNSVLYPLLNGSTAVLEPAQPTEESVLTVVDRCGVDILFAVPSVYARLLAHPEAGVLRGVRIAVCAGEVLPKAVENGVAALGGPLLLNGLGSTEAGQTFTSNTVDEHRAGTVGRSLPPYEVRVVDDAGNDVPAGTEGRLLVRGPTVSSGCASVHELPLRRADEWHPTGDAATQDQDGFLRISGRLDDLEIIAGVNVHPAEIEELFLAQPQVSDAAVCAVTDAQGVSRLVAYVVPKPAGGGDVQKEKLIAGLRGKIAGQKIPQTVVFVPQLPRTPTGKLRRRALREASAAFHATGSWQI